MTTRHPVSTWAILAILIPVVVVGVHVTAQTPPELRADFTKAAVAEVRDAQGTVVLRGDFVQIDEDDDDIERKATLKAAGPDPDAAGDAEVEFPKTTVVIQEVEFSVKNLTAGASYTFVIDGKTVTTVVANKGGKAGVDSKVRMPVAGGR